MTKLRVAVKVEQIYYVDMEVNPNIKMVDLQDTVEDLLQKGSCSPKEFGTEVETIEFISMGGDNGDNSTSN